MADSQLEAGKLLVPDLKSEPQSELLDLKGDLFVDEGAHMPSNIKDGNVARSFLGVTTTDDNMMWHNCDTDDSLTNLQRVSIKEKAIEDAITRLRELIPKLEAVQDRLPTSLYLERIGE